MRLKGHPLQILGPKIGPLSAANPPGGACYVGVPRDVPFSWVYFLPENSEAGYTFRPKILK